MVLLAFLLPLAVLVSRAATQRHHRGNRPQPVVVSAVATGAGTPTSWTRWRPPSRTATVGVRVVEAAARPRPTSGRRSDRTGDGGAVLAAAGGRRRPEPCSWTDRSSPEQLMREGVGRAWVVLGVARHGPVRAVAGGRRPAGPVDHPPITDLADAAERLGRGDLAARVEPDGPDEVREVGRALNLLARTDRRAARPRSGSRSPTSRTGCAPRSPRCGWTSSRCRPGPTRDRLTRAADELTRQIDALIARGPPTRSRRRRAPAATPRRWSLERVAFWQALAEDQGRRGLARRARRDAARCGRPRPTWRPPWTRCSATCCPHTPDGTGFAVTVLARPGAGRPCWWSPTRVRASPTRTLRGPRTERGRLDRAGARHRPPDGGRVRRRPADRLRAPGGGARVVDAARPDRPS